MRILLLTDEGTNFASGGFARASTIDYKSYPRYAIDGNPDGVFSNRSCTLTSQEWNPWWSVTLQFDVKFREVVIVNRADCCGKWSTVLVFPESFRAVTNLPETLVPEAT